MVTLREAAARIGVGFSLSRRVDELSVAERWLVMISKALVGRATMINEVDGQLIARLQFALVQFACDQAALAMIAVSAAATARNSFAIWGNFSASALAANARYLRFAWLSPAKAASKFFSVCVPFRLFINAPHFPPPDIWRG